MIKPIDLTALTAQVEASTTIVQSVLAVLAGQAAAIAKAVTDALTADNAADQSSIDAAQVAIDGVVAEYKKQADDLAAAIVANTPNA